MAVCERRYPPRRQGPLVHKHLDRSWSRRDNVTDAQRQKHGSQFWKLGESKRHRILHSRAGRSGRTHRDRNAGWRHWNGRAAWRRGPRGQPHFVLPSNVYVEPPGRGTFWFQIFIQAPSPEIWRKTISDAEGGLLTALTT